MKTIRTEYMDEYEYQIIRAPIEERNNDVTPLSQIYEHLHELELNKPIGKCTAWDKKYSFYKNELKKYEIN